jgi:hypothetical protein
VYVQYVQNNSLYLRPVNRDLANVQDCFLLPVGSRNLAHNLSFKAITGTAERVRTWRTCPHYRGVARGGAELHPPPRIWQISLPYSIQGTDYAPHITASPPGIKKLYTPLR